jgi:hypothetical protein
MVIFSCRLPQKGSLGVWDGALQISTAGARENTRVAEVPRRKLSNPGAEARFLSMRLTPGVTFGPIDACQSLHSFLTEMILWTRRSNTCLT